MVLQKMRRRAVCPIASGSHASACFIRVLRRNFPNLAAVRVEGPVRGCNGANPCTEPVIDGVAVQITAATRFT
jgi:hypothetical protein